MLGQSETAADLTYQTEKPIPEIIIRLKELLFTKKPQSVDIFLVVGNIGVITVGMSEAKRFSLTKRKMFLSHFRRHTEAVPGRGPALLKRVVPY
jgi:hypothetical protein